MLVVWGLTTIVAMTRDSVLKGLAVAGIGFLVASIGFDPRTAESRYAFGSEYLRNGVSHVPIFLGLLALAELITLAASGRSTISGRTRAADLSGSRWEGSLAVFKHFGLFIRSSIIGTTVGMNPGNRRDRRKLHRVRPCGAIRGDETGRDSAPATCAQRLD